MNTNPTVKSSPELALSNRKRKQMEARIAGITRDMEQIQNVNRMGKFVAAESKRADIFLKQKKVRFASAETRSGTGEKKQEVKAPQA